jgi:endogenous inhibitor of DNA gyrase (YacG/DUF329 family)
MGRGVHASIETMADPAKKVRGIVFRLNQKHGQRAVAAAASVTKTMASRWAQGVYLPSLEQAHLLDERIGALGLVEAVKQARTRHCPRCGTAFVTKAGNARATYCDRKCRDAVRREKWNEVREVFHRSDLIKVTRQLGVAKQNEATLQGILDEFCRMCPEGESVCGNGTCPGHKKTRHICVVSGCREHRASPRRAAWLQKRATA